MTAVDEEVEAVVRGIQALMSEGKNPTFGALLYLSQPPPAGVWTEARLRRVLRRGVESGRLIGPGSGRSTGYRFRTAETPKKKEDLSSIFGVILRPKPGSLIFFGKTLQNVGAALSKSGIVLVTSGRPPKVAFDRVCPDGLPLWWGVLVEDGWDRARRVLAADGWSARPSLPDTAWCMTPDLQGVLLLAEEFEARDLADVVLAELVDGRLRLLR